MTPIIWRLLVARAHYRRTNSTTQRTGILANTIRGKMWLLADYLSKSRC